MELPAPKKRGRPPGPPKPPPAPAHRPPQLNAAQRARYAHWRAWWPTRPNKLPSAWALAARMEQPASTVRAAANGHRPPSPTLLANLEQLSSAFGFEPLCESKILA